MITALHDLRKNEEGQTLVLAAIFGLVLMMCVLGTVNLGRAVYDKVQVQAAADGEAYSLAALEARAMNFTAYTNRAMVVHYASVMAATSYLTWVHFIWAGLKPILTVLSNVPYIGPIFQVIKQVFAGLITVLDYGLAFLSPILCAANLMLWGLQEGAWSAVWLRLSRGDQPEAHSGDSAAHPYVPIWPRLLPLANAAVFSQARGQLAMPLNFVESAKILVNAKSDTVQEARLHMLEIANSARQPWTAYGDRYSNPTVSPLGRHFRWGFSFLNVGSVARTEMGGYAPAGGIIGGTKAAVPQIWSGERFQLSGKIPILGKFNKNLFSFVAMDQLYKPYGNENSYYLLWRPGKLLGKAIAKLIPGFNKALDGIEKGFKNTAPKPDYRAFLMSPYVFFAPHAKSAPGLGPAGAPGNFAQPDVITGLALEGRDFNREPGASTIHGRRFSWNGRGAGRGAVDFRYGATDWPQIPGLPKNLQVLHKGFNAFSAAQVYYHRPGDWKEMPNLFNPLWGARLMPVLESNVAARIGIAGVPLLKQLLLH